MNDQLPTGNTPPSSPVPENRGRHSGWKLFGILLAVCIVSVLVALTVVYFILFPRAFTPVTLSAGEEQALERKLDRLESLDGPPGRTRSPTPPSEPLKPERYTETAASREIVFTERELNALLAKNTDLASKLAIDLAPDLASAKLLVPLDEEFPFLGGKTVKVTAGLEMSYRGQRPLVILRGVSLWGVPLPNAWLGNLKNVDLVREFGNERGFWKAFADGVEEIEIGEGTLRLKLKE